MVVHFTEYEVSLEGYEHRLVLEIKDENCISSDTRENLILDIIRWLQNLKPFSTEEVGPQSLVDASCIAESICIALERFYVGQPRKTSRLIQRTLPDVRVSLGDRQFVFLLREEIVTLYKIASNQE